MRLALVFAFLASAACGSAQTEVSEEEVIFQGGALTLENTIEAETMDFPPMVGEVFADSLAGGGKGLLLRSNGTAEAQVTTGAVTRIVVRALGNSCKGAPQMVVKLNGREVQNTRVSSTQWSDFSAEVTEPAGAQRVEVSYSNDHSSSKCDRNLRIDRIQFVETTTSAPTPTPTPTSTVEAETLALASGGGAVRTDSSASAGAALLLWTNETASGDYTTRGVTNVTVRARGQLCDGAPEMILRIDGVDRLTRLVESTTWTEYTVALGIPDGPHRITVAFTNDVASTLCDRNLFVDRLSFSGEVAAIGLEPEPIDETASTNLFANATFYVNPASDAARQAEAWRASRPNDAAQMDKIAQSADAAVWFGEWNSDITMAVSAYVNRVTSAGALPVLVAYNMPRDGYSAGGLGSPEAYRNWIRAFAAGLGGKPSVIILEPDAIALANTLSAAEVETRMSLLKDAVGVLSQAGGQVYIDAGNSAWRTAEDMAKHLIEAGVGGARGFSLNVSSFRPTSDEVTYGKKISALIGGKTFIVDTSRNGLGALGVEWCNPDGRALGPRPTSATGDAWVDAFFWVKRPGESDGTCNGGPAAGLWYPEYALGLAQRASY